MTGPATTPRVVLLLSGLLGNRILSERLADAAAGVLGGAPPAIWFGADDYRRHPAPRLLRIASELEAEYVYRRSLAAIPVVPADAVIACTWHVAMAAGGRYPRANWIVATDSTPALVARLRAGADGRQAGSLARRGLRAWQEIRFRRLVRCVRTWLPMSAACRDSLVGDYGADAARCHVTRAPQPRVLEAVPPRDLAGGVRLVFVGNDFARKGGPELCAAVCGMRGVTLTVVSNDPAAEACAEQGRISVVRGITDPAALSSIYSGAHLLVHPTRFDLYSHVICEGLAHGLPFAVSANTPAAELVAESGAGVLIAPPVSADSIATAIRAATEPSGYARREAAALSFAQRCLRMEHLAELVRAALDAAAR